MFMRKLLSICLLLVLVLSVRAQTQVGGTGSPIYYENGNVGVGNNSPQYSLDVFGKTRLINYASSIATWDNLMMWVEGEKSFIQSNGDEKGLFIKSNNGNKIILQSKVGIGTELPEEVLHVCGDVLFDLFESNSTERGIFFRKGFSNSKKYNLGILLFDHNDGGVSPDGLTIAAYDGVSFSTGSNDRNERMRINSLGYVGIGTTSPKSKLDVAGTITATEIKVEAQTADFVFEDDYQLKSLTEVEQFIQTNNHLPDIPSAKQMKEDGVGLAEMNKLLLQKVEELTLYLIETNRDKEAMKTDLRSMQSEIDSLRADKVINSYE